MFDKQLTFVNKTFKDKADAINFLIHEAVAAGKLNGGEAYRKSVLQREEEFSTAVGYEVAIPHGSSDDVTESFVAVSTVKKPILWGEESIRMIFMIGVPEHKRTREHLQILAWLSRNLMHDEFRNSVVNAGNEIQLFECLSRLEQ